MIGIWIQQFERYVNSKDNQTPETGGGRLFCLRDM